MIAPTHAASAAGPHASEMAAPTRDSRVGPPERLEPVVTPSAGAYEVIAVASGLVVLALLLCS